MKVDDLKTLSCKILAQIQATKVSSHFKQFHENLDYSVRGHRSGSVSEEKDSLFACLRAFDEMSLTYSEANLFKLLGYGDYVGESAVKVIETVLYDSNFDPQGVVEKVEAKREAFEKFVEQNRNLQSALEKIPTLKDVALNSGEALLEITFADKATTDNIMDFERWIDAWTKIIRSFSELVGEKPESSRIVFVQKSSPLIIDVATAYSLVLLLGKAVDCVLEKVEKYLSIRKQVEEIRKLKLENKQIEKQLEEEAENYSEKTALEITAELTKGITPIPSGDVVNGIGLGVRKLFVFIDKGGRVDCPSASDDEEKLEKVYKQVRQLQKTVDTLRLLPEASKKSSRKHEDSSSQK